MKYSYYFFVFLTYHYNKVIIYVNIQEYEHYQKVQTNNYLIMVYRLNENSEQTVMQWRQL